MVVLHIRDLYYSGAASWPAERPPELDAFLEGVTELLRSEGVTVHRVVADAPHGHAGKAIAEFAPEESADLIVMGMGSTGRSQLAGLALGSVSARTLRFARCPVLIVKGWDATERRAGQDAFTRTVSALSPPLR